MLKKTELKFYICVVAMVAALIAWLWFLLPNNTITKTEQITLCVIPPGYLDKPEIIIQERLKTQIIKIYSSTFQKQKINKKEAVSKKSVNPTCKTAFELCKKDKGCHAEGCEELSFYKKGLEQNSGNKRHRSH